MFYAVLPLVLVPPAAGWAPGIGLGRPRRQATLATSLLPGMMSNDGEKDTLQSSLRRAAADKLGASIESMMKPEDLAWYQAGGASMAAALQEAREKLVRRKAEIGEEAALAELEIAARASEAALPNLLKARPVVWLLDRDGCINEDVGPPGVVRTEDLRLIPGSAQAIRRLRLSAKVAIITNQSSRGRGLLSAAELDAIHERMSELMTAEGGGQVGGDPWDALYVCEDAESTDRKKPAAGMILEALRDFECAPSEAVMIGDSWSDVVAAQRAGCVGVLLATGHGASLGALLREQGVRLPITLTIEPTEPAATAFVSLQQSLASAAGSRAARAVEDWLLGRSEEEAALAWEALQNDSVRVYADLAQAVDELVAMASAL